LGLFSLCLFFNACQKMQLPLSTSFDAYPVYEGSDLGLKFGKNQSVFKLWSPIANQMRLLIYEKGEGGEPIDIYKMKPSAEGVWSIAVDKDLEGKYYAFQARVGKTWKKEVVDPYAKAVGINGDRGQVIDMSKTNPSGWEIDTKPSLRHTTDAIIYELHVRDISTHESSGIQAKGKFLGLVEKGTKSPDGLATGIDHMKELGITHVHLLPSYDFRSLDERRPEDNVYNWGYDPKNYNVPEGSYSTDPYDASVRIREFKTMVQRFHERGIGVILDVVYNHTGDTEGSNFNQLVPGYYYRQNSAGGFSNASDSGN
ncbi:MAG: alpha-amylase family glycosyl hydrolase, partial [Bacteroidota bacterium]